MRTHAPVSSRRNRAVLIEGLEIRTLMAAPIADTGFYATLPHTTLNVAAPGVFTAAAADYLTDSIDFSAKSVQFTVLATSRLDDYVTRVAYLYRRNRWETWLREGMETR